MNKNMLPLLVIILSLFSLPFVTGGCAFRLLGAQAGNAAEASALNDAAYELIKRQDYAAALPKAREAVRLAPSSAEAQKNLALALCELKNYDEALAPAREAVRLKPDFDKAHNVLGKVMFGMGRFVDSIAEYREAIRLNGNYDKAYFNLGVAYDRLNEVDAAAGAMREAISLQPHDELYRIRLARVEKYLRRDGSPAPAFPAPRVDAAADNYAYYNYSAQVRDYLYHEQFDALDRIAAEVRASKERLPGGAWKLEKFYKGLCDLYDGDQTQDGVWQYHLAKLKKWVAQKPASVTARIGLASAYVKYAWLARGGDYAANVPEAAWKVFRERLATAEAILQDAARLEPKCPHWYAVMMNVALSEGWDRSRYEQLFGQAVKFEPFYYDYYEAKAHYLMPRWNGRPGEWESFAEGAAHQVGGKEGSIIYYRIAMSIAASDPSDVHAGRFAVGSKVSWAGLEQGFADVAQTYGSSAHEANMLCLMAVTAGEKPLSQKLFKQIGENWDINVWGSQNTFEAHRRWADGKS